jgi:hypothetical protein
MAATLLPNAKQQFLDGNGKPLAGGQVFFYIPNTSTFKSTWQDPAQTILNTNPVVLDASGEAIIWGSGSYRQVVYDVNGNLIWDQITEDANAGLTGDMIDDLFAAGTDFTPGTTTQLTLSTDPGSINNTWIFFDGIYQADNQIASLSGLTLQFTSPIPLGTTIVTVKIGTTVAVGVPPAGSVTDATVAAGAGINASKLSFLQKGPGAVRRTVLSKLQGYFDVMDFGAKGDGTTDDTAAINACLQAAFTFGKCVYLPAGTYMVSDTTAKGYAILNPGVSIFGEGHNNSIISPLPTMPSASDFMCIQPPATGDLLDLMYLRDFIIFPGLSGTKLGARAVFVNTSLVQTNAADIVFSRLYCAPGNAVSMEWLNDAGQNPQGCPSNTVFEDCEFWEGTKFTQAGDSIKFRGGILRSSASSGRPGVNFTAVSGSGGVSARLDIDNVNGDCDGGFATIFSGFKPRIANCNIEQSHGTGSPSGSVIDIDGSANGCTGAEVICNTIGIFGTASLNSAVRINGALDARVDRNRLTAGVTVPNGILVTSNANTTDLGHNQIGTTFTTPVLDAGFATAGIRKPITPINSYSNAGSGNATLAVMRNAEGTVRLEGLLNNPGAPSGTGIGTVPGGFAPLATQSLNAYATVGGTITSVRVQIDTSGNIVPFSSGTITQISLSGLVYDQTSYLSSNL